MGTLTIRNIDDALKDRLRQRAIHHGRSIEAEVQCILREAIGDEPAPSQPNLGEAIRRLFAPLGGVDLELPPRDALREPPKFER
jgi:antitoxin FitA